MKIVITGGSGFIGSVLTRDLLAQGHDVVIYDKKESSVYPQLCSVADVRDSQKLTAAIEGADVVYHLAAEHRDDVTPVSLYYDVNVTGAANLIDACDKNGITKIIFTSSVALYGLNKDTPDESNRPEPFNDYGESKNQAEKVFEKWAEADKTRSLIMIRPAVVFGENNRGNVYNLARQIANGKFIMVGKGENHKSMGYVGNISSFLASLLNAGPGIKIYNYADKPDLTTQQLINTIHNALGKKKSSYHIPYLLGLCGGYCFDLLARITGKTYPISLIRIKKFCSNTQISTNKLQKSGFTAPFSLEEGLEKFIKHEFPQQ